MTHATQNAIRAILSADQTLSPADRQKALARLAHPEAATATGPKVLRFSEAARQLSLTTRALRYGLQAAGIEAVSLPGRSRAFGIRASDLDRLIGVCGGQ
jgi:hypothetical protein